MMIVAGAIGIFSVWAGLVLSYHWGIAASATMALVPIVLFFVVLSLQSLLRSTRQPVSA
jgi:manganese/iron transport system permease protein